MGGTGWTGQPNVIVGEHGTIEVRINAYDGAYHLLNGRTGEPVRPALSTSDLPKGSASSGSRDGPSSSAGTEQSYTDSFNGATANRPIAS